MGGDVQKFVSHARAEIGKVIVGQEEFINQMLAVLICGGHALLEGVPGIAKTLAVKALAHIYGLDFQRVQCTPDLMRPTFWVRMYSTWRLTRSSCAVAPSSRACCWWMR